MEDVVSPSGALSLTVPHIVKQSYLNLLVKVFSNQALTRLNANFPHAANGFAKSCSLDSD